MEAVIGRADKGRITLSAPVSWPDGQPVLVVPLTHGSAIHNGLVPPPELLAEDASEFRRRPETLTHVNREELA